MLEAQTTLSISELILFNSTKRRRRCETCTSWYHSTDREPSLPVYLGLMAHAETRKRTRVDELYGLGLSISYDRVLEISTEMGNIVCARYQSEGVECPPKLNKKIFTTAAVDNIDHNPRNIVISAPEWNASGEERDVINVENTSIKRLSQLPESYTTVQPVILPKKEPPVPALQGPFVSNCVQMPSTLSQSTSGWTM